MRADAPISDLPNNPMDSNTPKAPDAKRTAGTLHRACSPVACDTCHHWEWDDGKHGFMSGYCPIFDKITHKEDGAKCTAWEQIHLENATPVDLDRLVRLADECDQFAATLSLHRDKFPQLWKSFVELWNGNEDVWRALGVQKLGHIEATADASFRRFTRNHGHHVSFLEHACAQLAAALRSEANG